MKKFISLFLNVFLSLCSISYGQISKPAINSDIQRGVDPYFIETSDTISSFGPTTITRSILQDKKGNMWFATWQGIMKYDGNEFTNYTLKENLKHFHVFSIFEDRKGNLWFGTVRGGMYRFDGKSFKLFTTNEGLAGNSTSCMFQDSKGRIWFGTEKGISVLQSDEKFIFTNFGVNDGLSSNEINSISEDNQGNLWIGTQSGINRCSVEQTCDEIRRLKFKDFLDSKEQMFNKVWLLFNDTKGNMWISSINGVCKYNRNGFSEYLLLNPIMYLCEDVNGGIWTAYNNCQADKPRNFSLYHFNGISFSKVMDDPSNWGIFGITEDRSDNIWFGNGKGVVRLNPRAVDNACLKKICHHDLPLREAIEEHNQYLAHAYTTFQR
jgi:ligand-binding sensor domain-containing protein